MAVFRLNYVYLQQQNPYQSVYTQYVGGEKVYNKPIRDGERLEATTPLRYSHNLRELHNVKPDRDENY